MHDVTAGQGAPLLLLHGTPTTSFCWHRLFPLLAPDLRGLCYTDKPPASEDYDSATNATDVAELMARLGLETDHVHGEDRGAGFADGLAAL